MFRLKFDNSYDNYECDIDTVDEMTNLIFNKTGLKMFASHIRTVWKNANPGDIEEYSDVGVTIEYLKN